MQVIEHHLISPSPRLEQCAVQDIVFPLLTPTIIHLVQDSSQVPLEAPKLSGKTLPSPCLPQVSRILREDCLCMWRFHI